MIQSIPISIHEVPCVAYCIPRRSASHLPADATQEARRIKLFGSPYRFIKTLRYPLDKAFPHCLDTRFFYSKKFYPRQTKSFSTMHSPLKIVFLGDFLPPPQGKIMSVSDDVKLAIQRADIIILNLEAPISYQADIPNRKKNRVQWHPENLYETFTQFGVRPEKLLLVISNNHSLDYGETCFKDTVKYFQSKGIHVLGHKRSPNDSGIHRVIFDKLNPNGSRGQIRFGVLAYTEILNHRVAPSEWFINGPENSAYFQSINYQFLKSKFQLDFILILPHWGEENFFKISADTLGIARNFSQHGVDVLVGTGPHVLHRPECVEHMLMLSSIGNATSLRANDEQSIGAVTTLCFTPGGIGNTMIFYHQKPTGEIVNLDDAPAEIKRVAYKYYGAGVFPTAA